MKMIHVYRLFKNMRFFVSICMFINIVNAQIFPKDLPSFKIRLTDGNGFTYKDLKKGTACVLIYFSPSCDHCKLFITTMLNYVDLLDSKQIILISFEDIKEVREFDTKYYISAHRNVKIGSEGYTFVVQKFYNIRQFPFVVTFNKNRIFEKKIPWRLPVDSMVKALAR